MICLDMGHTGVISKCNKDVQYLEYATQFPSVIKIMTEKGFCSGVIIDDSWIISTKHSIQYKDNIRIIYKDQEFIPEKIIYHKNIDIALIKVNILNLNKEDIAELDPMNNMINKVCQIVGYGKTGNGETGATLYDLKKRAGNNTVIAESDEFINFGFTKDCDIDLKIMIAHGDSGGGVFIDKKLVAINAFVSAKQGDQDADSSYGDISGHIKISKIHSWIRSVLE
jgi:hypothetical protein